MGSILAKTTQKNKRPMLVPHERCLGLLEALRFLQQIVIENSLQSTITQILQELLLSVSSVSLASPSVKSIDLDYDLY